MPLSTSYDTQTFVPWDGYAEKWVATNTLDRDFPSTPLQGDPSLAVDIITNMFGLSLDVFSRQYGGSLPGYDIMSKDSMQMVQLSLAEELKNNKLVECYANGDGTVSFKEIGNGNADLNVWYSFRSSVFRQPCDNVIITGYDPPPKRTVKDLGSLFLLGDKYSDDIYKYENKGLPMAWAWTDFLGPEQCNYAKEGYLEYEKPFLGVGSSSSAFTAMQTENIADPKKFEQLVETFYSVSIPFYKEGITQVDFRNTTTRFEKFDSFGKLKAKTWISGNAYTAQLCVGETDVGAGAEYGFFIPGSDSKKFLGVKGVYIYGYQLTSIQPYEVIDLGTKKVEKSADVQFLVTVDSIKSEPFQLSQGDDFIVVKEGQGHKIIFASNISPSWEGKFGDVGNKVNCKISCSCIYQNDPKVVLTLLPAGWNDYVKPVPPCPGYLRDGTKIASDKLNNVLIFPIGDGGSGYVVNRIVIQYEWDNPCVAVYDMDDQATSANLNTIAINVYAVVITNRPAPMARNGILLDQSKTIPDQDPTTVQDLSQTDFQRTIDSLEGTDIQLTLPFLDEDGVQTVSQEIWSVQQQSEEVTTYICSPNSRVELGQSYQGKIVNSISHSYQDSSQYVISVQTGPIWQGLQSWEQALYQNQTEQVQLEGYVVSVTPDSSSCSVSIPRYGSMSCINASPEILEVGDRVKVTVHNNPVTR
jgi:hypothetical protein